MKIETWSHSRFCDPLMDEMYRDRAAQFQKRLGWNVKVDKLGREIDEFDILEPVYIICDDDQKRHKASLRLMPTEGPTMINDCFSDEFDGFRISRPDVWECTRLCANQHATRQEILKILCLTAKVMLELKIEFLVGVFDDKMKRLYRSLGYSPEVIRTSKSYFIGAWRFSEAALTSLIEKSGTNKFELELAFVNSPLFSRCAPTTLDSRCA